MADEADARFSIGWIPTLATTAGLVLLVSLGVWQTNQYLEKKRRETLQNRRVEREPVPITGLDDLNREDLDYRRAANSGTLDRETRIVVKHRHYDGDPGSWLVQPLELPDGRGQILVNRGWIPFQEAKGSIDPYAAAPDDPRLVGLLYRLPDVAEDVEKRRAFKEQELSVEGKRTDWDSFDATAIYDELERPTPTAPWVLVLAPRHSGSPYPIASYDHVTQPFLTSTRHLGYAVFWYTLASALVGIYVAAGFGALRSRRRGRAKVPNREED
jgi:cytochrome oxidase assembly protein ShyY1